METRLHEKVEKINLDHHWKNYYEFNKIWMLLEFPIPNNKFDFLHFYSKKIHLMNLTKSQINLYILTKELS